MSSGYLVRATACVGPGPPALPLCSARSARGVLAAALLRRQGDLGSREPAGAFDCFNPVLRLLSVARNSLVLLAARHHRSRVVHALVAIKWCHTVEGSQGC